MLRIGVVLVDGSAVSVEFYVFFGLRRRVDNQQLTIFCFRSFYLRKTLVSWISIEKELIFILYLNTFVLQLHA